MGGINRLKRCLSSQPNIPSHRKYLRFCFQGQCFQWKVMCFGPTVAPRVFTKLVSVVAAFVRTRNIRLTVYLDDWLNLNQIKSLLLNPLDQTLNSLMYLGFIINLEKSSLIPQQVFCLSGTYFSLKQAVAKPTLERLEKLQLTIMNLLNGQTKARDFLVLLGIMASCIELIPNFRLYMRPIQLHLLCFWNPSKHQLNVAIPLTAHAKSQQNTANILKGRSLQQFVAEITLTTDASKIMYGGHLESDYVQGTWSLRDSKLHINLLEMKAVHLSLQHFLPKLQGKPVLVRTDNTTVYNISTNKGTQSQETFVLLHGIYGNLHFRTAYY